MESAWARVRSLASGDGFGVIGDLTEGERGGTAAETRLLGVEVAPHLLLGRRDRLELPIGAQLVDQTILQRGAALLFAEPPAVLLRRLESRFPELFLVVHLGLKVVPDLPDLLLDAVGDLLIGHRDGGVAERLLDQ